MKTAFIPSTLLAATMAVGALTGMALPTAAQAQIALSVQIGPPPPPPVEVIPSPRVGWVWAPGHYEWRYGQYVWTRGYWMRERPGYAYVAPAWVSQGGRWVYQAPRWDRQAARPAPPPRNAGRDRGAPPRHDRRPDDRDRR